MVALRSCCLCVSPRTGSFILATLGIVFGAVLLAPMAVFLDFHGYYVTHYVADARVAGNYIDDDQVPKMEFFSKLLFSILLALDVIFILSSVLMLAGLAATKHILLLPWLCFVGCGIITHLTLVLAFMISIADYGSVAVFLATAPGLAALSYFWAVVFSTYQQIQKEEVADRGSRGGNATQTGSTSQSSLASLKEGLQRVIGGSPPPPYEAVAARAAHRATSPPASPASLAALLIKPASSPNSSASTSRRSSDLTPSTKPASPCPPLSCNSSKADQLVVVAPAPALSAQLTSCPPQPAPLTSSRSHDQICHKTCSGPRLRKSQSGVLTNRPGPAPPRLSPIASPKTTIAAVAAAGNTGPITLVRQEAVQVNSSNSELSDETSSMSSLSISDTTNVIL